MEDTGVKKLVKILIGAAWLDGIVQPEEKEYLYKVAAEKGMAADPEIQPLLNELKTVQPNDCYKWVREYLGEYPSSEAYQELLEAISGLIYRDGEVATEEARLLTKLQDLDTANTTPQGAYFIVLKNIQTLYRRWVSSQS